MVLCFFLWGGGAEERKFNIILTRRCQFSKKSCLRFPVLYSFPPITSSNIQGNDFINARMRTTTQSEPSEKKTQKKPSLLPKINFFLNSWSTVEGTKELIHWNSLRNRNIKFLILTFRKTCYHSEGWEN